MATLPPAYLGISTSTSSGIDYASAIVVTSASQLAGTLSSTDVYLIDGIIDFTGTGLSIEVPIGGLNLIGWTFDVSRLICSDSNYTLFTSPVGGSGNLLGKDYAIEVTGTNSQVYDLNDATGVNAFEFARINYNNCTSLGTIDSYRQGLETGTGRFGGTPELTLEGTWLGGYFIETSIVRFLDDGAYSLFKAGGSFTMASRFRSNQNIDLNSTVSFFDFSSNFSTPNTLQLEGCIVSRNGVFDSNDGTIIPNILESNLASSWNGNVGIPNTFIGGRQVVSSENLTNIVSGSTWYTLNAIWNPSGLSHFDEPSAGQLRHLGIDPIEFKFTASLTIEGSPNNDISVRFRKWDDSAGSFVTIGEQRRQINSFVGGRDVAFFTMIFSGF